MQQDLMHNTPEPVREYIREGLAIVAELDPPEDLRPVVLEKAIEYTAAKSITFDRSAVAAASILRPN